MATDAISKLAAAVAAELREHFPISGEPSPPDPDSVACAFVPVMVGQLWRALIQSPPPELSPGIVDAERHSVWSRLKMTTEAIAEHYGWGVEGTFEEAMRLQERPRPIQGTHRYSDLPPLPAHLVRSLEWAAEKSARLEPAASEPPPNGVAGDDSQGITARYLGNRKYQIDGKTPIVLQESEDHVLRSLIGLGGAGSKGDLETQTGKTDGPRILTAIREKHPELAPYIIMPGRKGKGGYRTTISYAESDKSK